MAGPRREPAPEPVSIPAGSWTLHGYLYRPRGSGPFPAILWNHGSERRPDSYPRLGAFYAGAGYALLIPHRHGHGRSPGPYELDEVAARTREAPRGELVDSVIAIHERYLEDVVAAAEWLAERAFVDRTRIAMSGVSHGGVQTLLAAEVDAGMRAYVLFAPAAIGWDGNPELQRRLTRAVRAAASPIFLLQAQNDFSLGPSDVLGPELRQKGAPNRARVYPPHGEGEGAGHGGFAVAGTEVWGGDVRAFLDEALGTSATPP